MFSGRGQGPSVSDFHAYHFVLEDVLKFGELRPLYHPLGHQSVELLEIHLTTIITIEEGNHLLNSGCMAVQAQIDEGPPQLLHPDDSVFIKIQLLKDGSYFLKEIIRVGFLPLWRAC